MFNSTPMNLANIPVSNRNNLHFLLIFATSQISGKYKAKQKIIFKKIS